MKDSYLIIAPNWTIATQTTVGVAITLYDLNIQKFND